MRLSQRQYDAPKLELLSRSQFGQRSETTIKASVKSRFTCKKGSQNLVEESDDTNLDVVISEQFEAVWMR